MEVLLLRIYRAIEGAGMIRKHWMSLAVCSLAAATALLVVLLLNMPSQSPLPGAVQSSPFKVVIWHPAKVLRLLEFPGPSGNAGTVDTWTGTLEDTATMWHYALYRDTGNSDTTGEAPLPLGLFVVGDTIQIAEGNGYVCAIAYQGHSLLTGEPGCTGG